MAVVALGLPDHHAKREHGHGVLLGAWRLVTFAGLSFTFGCCCRHVPVLGWPRVRGDARERGRCHRGGQGGGLPNHHAEREHGRGVLLGAWRLVTFNGLKVALAVTSRSWDGHESEVRPENEGGVTVAVGLPDHHAEREHADR